MAAPVTRELSLAVVSSVPNLTVRSPHSTEDRLLVSQPHVPSRSGRKKSKPARFLAYQTSDMQYENPSPKSNTVITSDSSGPSSLSLRKEKSDAMNLAMTIQQSLGNQFPSCIKIMSRSHVSCGFWLGLPLQFCKSFMPEENVTAVLEDEMGETCEVKYVASKNGFSAGWKNFAVRHNLMEGDVLLFHLVETTKFKVYILKSNDSNDVANAAVGLLNLETHSGQITPEKSLLNMIYEDMIGDVQYTIQPHGEEEQPINASSIHGYSDGREYTSMDADMILHDQADPINPHLGVVKPKRKQHDYSDVRPSHKKTMPSIRVSTSVDPDGNNLQFINDPPTTDSQDEGNDGLNMEYRNGQSIVLSQPDPSLPRRELRDQHIFKPRLDVRNEGMFSDSHVCHQVVHNISPRAESLRVSQMEVEPILDEIYQHYARLGALIPDVADKLVSYKSNADKAIDRASILEGRHKDNLSIMSKMQSEHLIRENELLSQLKELEKERERIRQDRVALEEERKIFDAEMKKFKDENEELKAKVVEDRNWLIKEGFFHAFDNLRRSTEFRTPLAVVLSSIRNMGFQEGLRAGYAASSSQTPFVSVKGYDPKAKQKFEANANAFENMSFPYLVALANCVDKPLSVLKMLKPKMLKKVAPTWSIAGQSCSGHTNPSSISIGLGTPSSPTLEISDLDTRDIAAEEVSNKVI